MKKFLILIISISMIGCVSPEDQARIDGATMFQSGMKKYNVNVESAVGIAPANELRGKHAEFPVPSSSAKVASVLKYKYFSFIFYKF